MKHRTLVSAKNKLPTYAKNVIEKNEMYTLSGSEGNVILLSERRYQSLYERLQASLHRGHETSQKIHR
jgi:PHD/YefM family antitoxin component YafN of YafNO toxin-antitoxin module